ncbi:hypothetical protein JI59_21925 (plasmid) [Novosphingobium pentaromativorans US6-1]|uniref:Uncharacterized protein n=1 Tax=Novosphingobium pentaromativorans US6-1 TaxID=1088721 RepID=G6EGI2_9SPHN|nr:hypothetical protein JI59_21925 [Novosphingobium pentaromativorans US6-1]EHJ59529.1 hypothetical protein NSU_3412 [Novosphingobium pentaromativorans US6-1]
MPALNITFGTGHAGSRSPANENGTASQGNWRRFPVQVGPCLRSYPDQEQFEAICARELSAERDHT